MKIYAGKHDASVNFWHIHATINGRHCPRFIWASRGLDFKPGYHALDIRLGRYYVVLRNGVK